jgi:hypothetical protein
MLPGVNRQGAPSTGAEGRTRCETTPNSPRRAEGFPSDRSRRTLRSLVDSPPLARGGPSGRPWRPRRGGALVSVGSGERPRDAEDPGSRPGRRPLSLRPELQAIGVVQAGGAAAEPVALGVDPRATEGPVVGGIDTEVHHPAPPGEKRYREGETATTPPNYSVPPTFARSRRESREGNRGGCASFSPVCPSPPRWSSRRRHR